MGNRGGEASTLTSIGKVYSDLREKQQALDYFQQALPLWRAVGNRSGEAHTLDWLGSIFQYLDQPELAIIFYKQSVNIYESLRDDIQGLDQEIQATYTESIASTYRRLADVLLAEDRILEAQRVLDLLKVQELDDYFSNVRGTEDTEQGITTRDPETIIIDGYTVILDDAIEVGQALVALSQIPPGDRTPAQREQVKTLRQAKNALSEKFRDFLASDQVQTELDKLRRNTGGENFDLDRYAKNLQSDLAALDNAVILYPLILDDRLELVVISSDAVPFRHTVDIGRAELNQAILDYRQVLTNHRRLDLATAQNRGKILYNLLIAPLAENLTALETKTIIYAPDGQLRYIPLAALYNGEQWLIENYNVNNITAVSLTNFTDRPSRNLAILAGAYTDGRVSIPLGDREITFNALPAAQEEVETLAATIPTTEIRLADDFNATDIPLEVEDYNIIHLATHAKFVSGTPEDSFILFNNQEKQAISDVETWDLNNVDLLVLSACQTAVGDELGDGKEILGLGFQMQRAGAKSTIASLWSVNDRSTQMLMNTFYRILANNPELTKAQAIALAQRALIQNQDPITGDPLRGYGEAVSMAPRAAPHYEHPYYWSPFILIGNGL